MKIQKQFLRFMLVSFQAFAPGITFACGLNLSTPNNHFDGVNENGNLAYWEKIGTLDLGDGLEAPLNINFNSARTSSSPYLGDGWILPFLEANVTQIDNKNFVMTDPDGTKIRLWRKNPNLTRLKGLQEAWIAEVGLHTITVWANCGWKMVYTDGKIDSITTPQNHQITYIYQNGSVTEVDKDGAPLLKVFSDSGGLISKLLIDGKQILFEEGPKPNIENINGQNVVGHLSSALTKVTMVDGAIDSFKYAASAQLIPTLTVSGANNRLFSWDPVTKFILQDGDWSYKIVPSKQRFNNAQITRLNSNGQSEFWYDNKKAGQEVAEGLDGVKIITESFPSGLLRGRIRKIIDQKPGQKEQTVYAATYDQKGGLVTEQKDGILTLFDKNHQIMQQQSLSDGKIIFSNVTDSANNDVITNAQGDVKAITASNPTGDLVQNVYISNKLAYTLVRDSSGQITKMEYPQKNEETNNE